MLNGYDVLRKADDGETAAKIYGYTVKHRRVHPVNVEGCVVCDEWMMHTVKPYYGMNVSLVIKVKEERKRKYGMLLDFRGKRRLNGGR